MGVPLYRQQQQCAPRGLNLPRQNMANCIMHAQHRLQPIYDRMKEKRLEQDIIHADGTTIQVRKEDDKKAQSQSYMWWLYRSGRDGPGIVLFEYQPARSGEHPKAFLKGFKGCLVTDACAGCNAIPGVARVGCWGHARRGFDEAIKAFGRRAKDPKPLEGHNFCNELFDIEREIEALGPHLVSPPIDLDIPCVRDKV
jgi:transposase